ncbi:MAG: hypothetical protein RDV48_26425 [Candidatus Eremiobacteraeota bacterium]|nr:hypothetical protein [Candidatus Eremiobacteraeota bacterium]
MERAEERFFKSRPAWVGELVDSAIWIFTDNLFSILKSSVLYLVLFAAGFAFLYMQPPSLSFLWFMLAPAFIPFLHLSLAPLSRHLWRDCLQEDFPPAGEGNAVMKGLGRFFGTLGLSLLCGLTFFLLCYPYVYALLVPAIIGITRAHWTQAYRQSREIVKGNPSIVAGVLLFAFGLMFLLAMLSASLMELLVPWVTAALEINIKTLAWYPYFKAAIYCALTSLALPLLEVSLVLMYRDTKIFREGWDFSCLLDHLEGKDSRE